MEIVDSIWNSCFTRGIHGTRPILACSIEGEIWWWSPVPKNVESHVKPDVSAPFFCCSENNIFNGEQYQDKTQITTIKRKLWTVFFIARYCLRIWNLATVGWISQENNQRYILFSFLMVLSGVMIKVLWQHWLSVLSCHRHHHQCLSQSLVVLAVRVDPLVRYLFDFRISILHFTSV